MPGSSWKLSAKVVFCFGMKKPRGAISCITLTQMRCRSTRKSHCQGMFP